MREILQNSFNVKNSENVDVSKNVCDGERHFFQNKGGI